MKNHKSIFKITLISFLALMTPASCMSSTLNLSAESGGENVPQETSDSQPASTAAAEQSEVPVTEQPSAATEQQTQTSVPVQSQVESTPETVSATPEPSPVSTPEVSEAPVSEEKTIETPAPTATSTSAPAVEPSSVKKAIPASKPSYISGKQTVSTAHARIAVSYDTNAKLPEGTVLKANEYAKGTEQYQAYMQRAEDTAGVQNSSGYVFDIRFEKDNQNTEPQSNVTVSISLTDASFKADNVHVVHFEGDNETPENVSGVTAGGKKKTSKQSSSVTFQTGSFSVYSIIIENHPTQTFDFYNGDKLYRRVILKDEETLSVPENPDAPEGETFAGWYSDKEGTTRFEQFNQPIAKENGTTNLYAKFSDKTVKIIYHYGDNIITTDTIKKGSSYTFHNAYPTFKITETINNGIMINNGWATTKSEGDSGDRRVYSDGTTVNQIDQDINVYPVIEARYLVNFRSDGGTQTDSVYVKPGEKVNEPTEPVWEGYEFQGWYSDQNYQTKYDFRSDVNTNLDLYAKWSPQEVTYKVAVWVENDHYDENLTGDELFKAKYQFVGSVNETGIAGDSINAETLDFYGNNAGVTVIRNHREGYMPYVYEADVTHNRNDQITIKNDGSTIVNLYYRYKTYRIQFCDEQLKPLTEFPEITERYPIGYQLTGNDTYKDVLNWNYHRTVYPNNETIGGQWNLAAKTVYAGAYDYISACKNSGASDIEDNALYRIKRDHITYNYTGRREVWHETLDSSRNNSGNDTSTSSNNYGKDPSIVYEYDLEGWYEGCIMGETEGFTIDHDLTTGYLTKTDRGTYYFYRYAAYSNKNDTHPEATVYYYTKNGKSYNRSSTPVTDGTENIIRFYAKRNKYQINLNKGAGPDIVNSTIKDIPYEDDISRYTGNISFKNEKNQEVPLVKDQSTWTSNGITYVFRGFYDNDSYAGDPVDLSTMKMPASNLALYAKWEPETFNVKFDVNGGTWKDSQPDTSNVSYGNNISKPVDPDPEPGNPGQQFLGWTLDGRTFAFSSPINRDITLKALYSGTQTYQITYDKNGGTGTAPEDQNLYLINGNAVVLDGNGLTKDGKSVVAWSTEPEGGILYYPGDSFSVKANTTLYAQYGKGLKETKIKYDFNPGYNGYNVGFGNDSSSTEKLLNNSTITLNNTPGDNTVSDNGFTAVTGVIIPDGYKFLGWSQTEDGTKPVRDILVDNRNDDKENVVYAMWHKYPDIAVSKVWNDARNAEGKRPDSVTVRLISDENDTGRTLTLSAQNHWSGTFENVPDETADGTPAVNTVKEDAVDGYQAAVSGSVQSGFTITNTRSENINVRKTWNDNNNSEQKRPDSVNIHLIGDDTVHTAVLNPDNNWQYTFANMPVYDGSGKKITYSVSEDPVKDYTVTISKPDNSDEFDLVNTYASGKTDLLVTKKWMDHNDADHIRPQKITVHLLKDGKETDQTLALDADNNWTGSFPAIDTEGGYSVKEDSVNGYSSSYSVDKSGGLVITNTHDTAVNTAYGDPSVVKMITGDTPETKAQFVFRIQTFEGQKDNPLPEDINGNISDKVTVTGEGSAEFGRITFTKPGVYDYTISEVNGGINGYTYDTSLYHVRYVVSQAGQDDLKVQRTITKSGEDDINTGDTAVFVNEYSYEKKPANPENPVSPQTPGDQPVNPESPGTPHISGDQPASPQVVPGTVSDSEEKTVIPEKKSEKKQGNDQDGKEVNTGDNNDVGIYGALMIFALLIAVASLIFRKKRYSD